MAKAEVTRIGEAAERFLGVVAERQAVGGVELVGLSTGFHKLDQFTGGMQEDELWIVGARTSTGKTAFALDIALNVARQDRGVLVYSMEMRAEALAKRLLSRMTEIGAMRIERGQVTDGELKRLREAADELAELKLGIVDKTMTSEELVEHALRVKEKSDVALAVVDYVQVLTDPGNLGETERVTRITNRLRALARPDQLDAPVLALAQLNRESEKREDATPMASDLKQSGSLEQDAEVVILLYRPYLKERLKGAEPLDVEDAQIIVAKNRDGMTGATRATFLPKQTRWHQPKPHAVDPRSNDDT